MKAKGNEKKRFKLNLGLLATITKHIKISKLAKKEGIKISHQKRSSQIKCRVN